MILSDFRMLYDIVTIVVGVGYLVFGVRLLRKEGSHRKVVIISIVIIFAMSFFDSLFVTSKSVTTNAYYDIVDSRQVDDLDITKVRLPHDKYEWIVIGNEPVSDDGEKVELMVKQSYNWCGLLVNQYVLNTCLYAGEVGK